jgi:hypothetical protein
MKTNWKHITTVIEGDSCKINGYVLNIWKYSWLQTGEKVVVSDPLYGQQYMMTVYELHVENQTIKFAAREFSNCVWGIYQEC